MSRKHRKRQSKSVVKRSETSTLPPVRRPPPPPSYAEQNLRKKIIQFGLSERFKTDLERAFEQYMGPGSVEKINSRTSLYMDDNATFIGFQEWFYFDYRLDTGKRIIDLFAEEVAPELPSAQRKILMDWLATNRQRLLETLDVEPGVGERMQDILSGEVLHLKDISYSYAGSRWLVFLGRTILTEGRWCFTGTGLLISPLDKHELVSGAKSLWAKYQESHYEAKLLDFYRDHSLDLKRMAEETLAERGKPKALITREGHAAVSATGIFGIPGSPAQVESVLDETEEFVYVGEVENGEDAGCLHYLWLLRGRSSVPEAPKDAIPPKALILAGTWVLGPGEPEFTTLGDVYLCQERLALKCLSKERLEAGKTFLTSILGGNIWHQKDEIKDLQTEKLSNNENDKSSDDLYFDASDWDDPQFPIVEKDLAERRTRAWLDTPGRDGLTPRQLAQTPEGRAELQEQMKLLEFIHDQALKEGNKPPMFLDIIREELGL
jgi:hypothetical protein